jgi:hypothetical protein
LIMAGLCFPASNFRPVAVISAKNARIASLPSYFCNGPKPEVRRPGQGEIRSDPLYLNETCSAWRTVLLIYVKEIPGRLRLA